MLVSAGAGTGKTRTIIARTKHLIESGVNPKRILILSFTHKSANEIVERISGELPHTKSEGLTGSTFHAWCMSLIKNHPQVFPQSSYTLLDEDDQESCFKLLCSKNWKHKGINDKRISPESICAVYSYMANAQCSLSDAIRMKLYDNAPKSMQDYLSGYQRLGITYTPLKILIGGFVCTSNESNATHPEQNHFRR